MTSQVFFDDSLPLLVGSVVDEIGAPALTGSVVLRDTSGRLSFFCNASTAPAEAARLDVRLRNVLGPYAPAEQSVFLPDALGAQAILGDPLALPIQVSGVTVMLVDRRLVGADWLRPPAIEASPPARFVFASLKGGVGRSTALCVAAAHLATRGLRVLTVDLDFEAPGLGALLLDDQTLPQFGVVDALVENGLGGIDSTFIADLVGPSSLATSGGRIDVIPALGLRSRRNPADALAKLARAYAEDIAPDGSIATVLDQVRSLVDSVAVRDRYDAVLVDARAGLHESSASAIIGLGAEVFLFGRDETQTFQGYSFLLAHLARLARRGNGTPEWLERLTPVHALAPADAAARETFAQRWEVMISETGIVPTGTAPTDVPLPDGFHDVPWRDDDAEDAIPPEEPSLLRPVAILRSAEYDGFDPLRRRDLLSGALYQSVFGALLERVEMTDALEEGP